MFKLDDNFLQDIGLGGLPAQDKNAMLQHIYETLELNVGMRLAEQMTDAQLDEFEAYIDKNDEAGAKNWLDTNLPQYKQVVAEELEKLKGEIRTNAPQILAATQQAQGQPQAAPAPQQMQQPAPQPHQPHAQPMQPQQQNYQPHAQPNVPNTMPPQQPQAQPTPPPVNDQQPPQQAA